MHISYYLCVWMIYVSFNLSIANMFDSMISYSDLIKHGTTWAGEREFGQAKAISQQDF